MGGLWLCLLVPTSGSTAKRTKVGQASDLEQLLIVGLERIERHYGLADCEVPRELSTRQRDPGPRPTAATRTQVCDEQL